MVTPEDVLQFWFGDTDLRAEPAEAYRSRWFGGGPALDQELQDRFGETLAQAAQGALSAWAETPAGRLALIVVLDQLSRNIYRGTPQAFAQDARALFLTLEVLASGQDRAGVYGFFQRLFLYTPLEHAEEVGLQQRCVVSVARLTMAPTTPVEAEWGPKVLAYAVQHHDIVERFGRFPHRNAVLGRASTPDEEAWLAGGGERFGQ